MDYIDKLTALREDNDISQKQIADLLGCRQSAVSKYETGKVAYRIDDLIKLCKFYNVSSDYILGISKSQDKNQDG